MPARSAAALSLAGSLEFIAGINHFSRRAIASMAFMP